VRWPHCGQVLIDYGLQRPAPSFDVAVQATVVLPDPVPPATPMQSVLTCV
jgi:hypothetical protein